MLDLSTFDTVTPSNEGAWLTPIGLNGEPVGIRIKIMGPDSDEYIRTSDEKARELTKKFMAARSEAIDLQDNSLSIEATVTSLARLTMAWEALTPEEEVTWEGQPFPCTRENAEMLYRKVAIIREQADKFSGRRANFTKGYAGASQPTSAKPAEPVSTSTGRRKTAARSKPTSSRP